METSEQTITCQRCAGTGSLHDEEQGLVSCDICDGEPIIDYATVAEYARQIDYYRGQAGQLRAENQRLQQADRKSRETGCWCDEHGHPCKGCEWRAENARLRKVLEQILANPTAHSESSYEMRSMARAALARADAKEKP